MGRAEEGLGGLLQTSNVNGRGERVDAREKEMNKAYTFITFHYYSNVNCSHDSTNPSCLFS